MSFIHPDLLSSHRHASMDPVLGRWYQNMNCSFIPTCSFSKHCPLPFMYRYHSFPFPPLPLLYSVHGQRCTLDTDTLSCLFLFSCPTFPYIFCEFEASWFPQPWLSLAWLSRWPKIPYGWFTSCPLRHVGVMFVSDSERALSRLALSILMQLFNWNAVVAAMIFTYVS